VLIGDFENGLPDDELARALENALAEATDIALIADKLRVAAYFGERDHRFRFNVISESGGR